MKFSAVKGNEPTDTLNSYAQWKKQDSEAMYNMVPFIWHLGKGKTIGTETRKVVG